jgi:ribosomal protein S18 acetylase RimI-like enzyme
MPPPPIQPLVVAAPKLKAQRPVPRGTAVKLAPLAAGQESEVLAFLGARPLHTVMLASFIRDNGLASSLNRGTFYCCRDTRARLVGVALLGHTVLIEARTDAALAAFAAEARACPQTHLIIGEEARVKRFWWHYADAGQEPHHTGRELLYEQHWPVGVWDELSDLRPAVPADLEAVAVAHADLALRESGVNPLEIDPVGFRARIARRIERGRVWVWVEAGRLIFKADVVSETPEVSYLEGVHVNPAERGKGYGLRCLSQLTRALLRQTKSVCLLVNEQNVRAQDFYERAGFKLNSYYSTIYLRARH